MAVVSVVDLRVAERPQIKVCRRSGRIITLQQRSSAGFQPREAAAPIVDMPIAELVSLADTRCYAMTRTADPAASGGAGCSVVRQFFSRHRTTGAVEGSQRIAWHRPHYSIDGVSEELVLLQAGPRPHRRNVNICRPSKVKAYHCWSRLSMVTWV